MRITLSKFELFCKCVNVLNLKSILNVSLCACVMSLFEYVVIIQMNIDLIMFT